MKYTNSHLLALASFYLRSSPIPAGRWRLVQSFLPVLRDIGPTLGERVVQTRYGFKYKADLGDWLGQYVYLTGTYEPPTAALISSILEPGDTFIDVGANSGFFTLLAATRVGPLGHVHSFEPLPSMAERIKENLALNGMETPQLHNVALSNNIGEIVFYEGPAGHKGLSSLRPIEEPSHTIQIRTARLDKIIDDFSSIKLIKIDVEGAEELVLEGMEDIFSEHHPYLIIEVTNQYLGAFGHSARSLSDRLRNVGYAMYGIEEGGLTPIAPGWENQKTQYNALFTPGALSTGFAINTGRRKGDHD